MTMGEYGPAAEASTSSLNIIDELIDYNDLDANAVLPFPNGKSVYNNEIIYYTDRMSNSFNQLSIVTVLPELLDQFHENDLIILFKTSGEFKGVYGGMPMAWQRMKCIWFVLKATRGQAGWRIRWRI